jgi:hypothetical protein
LHFSTLISYYFNVEYTFDFLLPGRCTQCQHRSSRWKCVVQVQKNPQEDYGLQSEVWLMSTNELRLMMTITLPHSLGPQVAVPELYLASRSWTWRESSVEVSGRRVDSFALLYIVGESLSERRATMMSEVMQQCVCVCGVVGWGGGGGGGEWGEVAK